MAATITSICRKAQDILSRYKCGYACGIFSVTYDRNSRLIRVFGDGLLLLKGVATMDGKFQVVAPVSYVFKDRFSYIRPSSFDYFLEAMKTQQ